MTLAGFDENDLNIRGYENRVVTDVSTVRVLTTVLCTHATLSFEGHVAIISLCLCAGEHCYVRRPLFSKHRRQGGCRPGHVARGHRKYHERAQADRYVLYALRTHGERTSPRHDGHDCGEWHDSVAFACRISIFLAGNPCKQEGVFTEAHLSKAPKEESAFDLMKKSALKKTEGLRSPASRANLNVRSPGGTSYDDEDNDDDEPVDIDAKSVERVVANPLCSSRDENL